MAFLDLRCESGICDNIHISRILSLLLIYAMQASHFDDTDHERSLSQNNELFFNQWNTADGDDVVTMIKDTDNWNKKDVSNEYVKSYTKIPRVYRK